MEELHKTLLFCPGVSSFAETIRGGGAGHDEALWIIRRLIGGGRRATSVASTVSIKPVVEASGLEPEGRLSSKDRPRKPLP
jgi:hypothetical protein